VPAASRSVLVVTPEATPFAKTGGLADVAGALPLALGRLGHRVTLVLPRYRHVEAGTRVAEVPVALGPNRLTATFTARPMAERVQAILVDCPELYDRDQLYGVGTADYADNARRFAFLSRAALELVRVTGDVPEVIHAHDWQAGLTAVYLKTGYASHGALAGVPVVFTIHNLAYQGLFPRDWMGPLGLPEALFTVAGFEYWGSVSFLKAGINFSEIVTTVSPRYAREIQTPEFGFGFEDILAARSGRLVGILNGIDVERWDPAGDPYVPVRYGPSSLDRKRDVKKALLEELDLAADSKALGRPVVGIVSRMVDQKGFDLLSASAERLLALPVTMALLGSGDPRYEGEWSALAARHPARVGVRIGFDDRLAHLIIAGADIFLMPSRFEPCGLSQMYSHRYGTVPVVRRTGGLDDTVENWDSRTGQGTGFAFREYTPEALLRALRRALKLFGTPRAWRALQRAAMHRDHSWDVPAKAYAEVYERAIRLARGGTREVRPGPESEHETDRAGIESE